MHHIKVACNFLFLYLFIFLIFFEQFSVDSGHPNLCATVIWHACSDSGLSGTRLAEITDILLLNHRLCWKHICLTAHRKHSWFQLSILLFHPELKYAVDKLIIIDIIEVILLISIYFSTPYIEQPRLDEPTKQLKIVNIEAKHRGNYYCQAVVGGNLQQITVTLELFGKLLSIFLLDVALLCIA